MSTFPSIDPKLHSPAAEAAGDCVHHLFEQQAARTPAATALEFEGRRLTYRQLDERANQWAHRLRELGVGPETLVGLCVERSLELVIAIYSILKAGGAYVPLDPHFPAARLAMILDDARPAVLVTQRSLESRCTDFAGPRFWVDEPLADFPLSAPRVPVGPGHAAYVIYTSGSTGLPKGVVLEHRSVVSFVLSACIRPGLTSDDVVLGVITVSFDMSVFDWFVPLSVGARLVIGPDFLRSDGAALMARIQESGATLMRATPSIWKLLLQGGWSGRTGFKIMPGGEALPPDLARQLHACGKELWNCYGPTETTAFCLTQLIVNPDDITIGTPLSHVRAYVVDDQLRPVPAGSPGELVIGGPSVARGYLNRPQLTAELFIADPFSDIPDARLYRTGDLCSLRADGKIAYLGRIDNQVKLHGFRIELGEIETALRAIDGVRDAAVFLRTDASGEKQLAGFIVGAADTPAPSQSTLKAVLAQRLPGYMIPGRFIQIERLPLTGSGKLDRLALAQIAIDEEPAAISSHASPARPDGSFLQIVREVLGQDHVEMGDNFFDLGGHSLLAVVICSRLSRLIDKPVRVRWLFDHPVLEDFLRHLSTQADHENNGGSIPPADRSQPLPMSFAQQGLWLLDQLLPDPSAYNVPCAFRVKGPLDRARLSRSLHSLMARHEVLRTSLGYHDGQPVQHVFASDALPVPLSEIPLPVPPPAEPLEAARAILTESLRHHFDLEQAPQWRAVIVPLSESDHILAFNFHHGIVDEWSVRSFAKELSALYAADGRLEVAGLPALSLHYADFAAWQRRELTPGCLSRLQTYWSAQLADFPPPVALPFARRRNAPPTGQGAEHRFQLSSDLVSDLRRLARMEGTTAFTVMLAAFHAWLYFATGQNDLIVSTPVTRRNHSELLHLLGFFINTVPVRARFTAAQDFKTTLREIRATCTESFDHADLPFEQLVALVMHGRDPIPYPLHQIMFVLVDEAPPSLHLAQTETQPFPQPATASKNDLTLLIDANAETWNCRLQYATDLFDLPAIERLTGQFTQFLHSVAAAPEKPVNDLNVVSESERLRATSARSPAAVTAPIEDSSFCLHHRFEQQAARAPDAVALVYQNDSLTYGELNRQADQIAVRLRRLGARPDVLVGLWMEPSLDLLVGLLGILKAGGAYLPIDPRYPHDRATFMLSDSRAVALVTNTSIAAALPPVDVPLVLVDALETPPHPADNSPPHAAEPVGPDHLAYVIYTSGTTGRPKGVMITHRNVARLFTQTAPWFSFDEHDVWTLFHSIAFDFSVWEVWGAWLYGGRLLVVEPAVRRTPVAFHQLLVQEKVTVLSQTPSAFVQLIAADEQAVASPLALRFVVFGGEALDMPVLRPWFDRHGDEYPRLINMYGITETTVHVTYRRIVRADLTGASVIGEPIPDLSIHLVDTSLQPVPEGAEGEICVGGAGLARGYLNRPELTAERFVPDPFNPAPDARLYRSGDLARRRSDGDLEYLGRIDHQVKIRGHRVELGEIETALAAHPAVRQAVVLVSRDVSGSNQLIAYLVAPASPANAELRRWLLKTLPDYMVPARFIALAEFPLTSNGKVDRRALPDPSTASTVQAQPGAEPPRAGLETTLAQAWSRLFQRETIGRDDNFFELGGHSLLAARLTVELEKSTGRRIPIAALFQAPTVAGLARMLGEKNWTPRWTSLVALQTAGKERPLFCIHGRTGEVYGFLDLALALAPNRPVYGLQALGLDGVAVPEQTIEEIAAHYVREIRSVQPEGPYLLMGHSLGGWFAFAVAQELLRQGQSIARLILLDTGADVRLPLRYFIKTKLLFIPSRIGFHLRHSPIYLRRHLGPSDGDRLRRLWNTLRKRLRHHLNPFAGTTTPPLVPNSPESQEVAASAEHVKATTLVRMYKAVNAYRPPAFHGSAAIVVSRESRPHSRAYWPAIFPGGIHVVHTPYGHSGLLEKRAIADTLELLNPLFLDPGQAHRSGHPAS